MKIVTRVSCAMAMVAVALFVALSARGADETVTGNLAVTGSLEVDGNLVSHRRHWRSVVYLGGTLDGRASSITTQLLRS